MNNIIDAEKLFKDKERERYRRIAEAIMEENPGLNPEIAKDALEGWQTQLRRCDLQT